MNYKKIAQVIAPLLLIEVVFMVPALLIAAFEHDMHVQIAYLKTMVVIILVAGLLWWWSRDVINATANL